MTIFTAVAILLILFTMRFLLPLGVIMLVKWADNRYANYLA